MCCIVPANEDFAEGQGDILADYVRLLLTARELRWRDQKKCAKIQTRYTGVHPEIVQAILREGHISFADLAPDREKIEKTMDMALRAGTIEKKCGLSVFVSSEFM